MDNLTHSLFGWTLARAGAGRRVPYATATLVVASNIPDVDIAAGLRGGVEYLAWHRGPTHGPLGAVGLGFLVAGAMALWSRNRRDLLRLWGLAMIGIACHIVMDLPTSYGTRLLSPFDWTWYAFDWMPIIDVYLWIVLLASVAAGSLARHRRTAAFAALALMAVDYSARAALHERALGNGARFDATGTAAPCAAAPTLVAHSPADAMPANAPAGCLAAAALPTFGSPLTWRIVRQSADGYELSDRSVLTPSASGTVIHVDTETGPPVQGVRDTPEGQVYLDFARFPIAETVARSPGAVAVRLSDARFVALLPGGRRPPGGNGPLSVVVTIPGQ